MSGIGPLHDADIDDSMRFLIAGESPLWPSPRFRPAARALDIGAGIGRVSGALLMELCGEVDLVDGSAAHLEEARRTLGEPVGEEVAAVLTAGGGRPSAPDRTSSGGGSGGVPSGRGRVGRYICSDLQDFVLPHERKYDLVWIQWTTMYLTDADLTRLLRECQAALAPGGMIVLKDNVIDVESIPKGVEKSLIDGRYMVDEEDASVSRTRAHLIDLMHEAGLAVAASETAKLYESESLNDCLSQNGWQEMHPVAMLALVPAAAKR